MKKHLAPWILGVLFLLCCSSRGLAQEPASSGAPPPVESSIVAPAPSASSAADHPVVSASSGVVPSSDPPAPSVTGVSSAVSAATSASKAVKPTASSSRSSSKETESVAPAEPEKESDANTVHIFGLTVGIIPLIAIVLGLAFIILYIGMSCVLRRRKLEMRRMRASFADMRNRLNSTIRPKATVIPTSRPSSSRGKLNPSTSNTPLYPSMSQNDSSASLNWTPPVQPQSGFADGRLFSEQGYPRRTYHPNHVSQPPPVHQQQPQQQQQQQAYPQPHGYPYGYGGGLPKIDGMYGVVDGYYQNYHEQQPNPYVHPQAYRPEPSDGTYRINMEPMEQPPTQQQQQQLYQNDYSGVYANVNYYPEGTQYPQRSSTAQHYDPGMLRTRRSSSRARSVPYTVPQEPPLPSPEEKEKEPRGLRAVNVSTPTSPSGVAIPEMTGDDTAV